MFGSEPSKEEREARAERYQVRLSKVGESVQVTVEKNINTVAPADVARRVLSAIQDHLAKCASRYSEAAAREMAR